MQEVRAQLDDESWPHGLRFTSHLDGEVLGLDEEGIAATTIPFGLDLGAQPLGTVDGATVLSVFRRLLCLTQLAVDLGAHSPLRGDGQRIQSSQQRNGLARLRLGCRLNFARTPASLWL